MTKRKKLSLADAAAMDVIGKIADRAVGIYASNDIEVDRQNVLMDVSACHFGPQKLRLDDLLAADELNFIHDIGGINKHLDRDSLKLTDCWSPRFSLRRAA